MSQVELLTAFSLSWGYIVIAIIGGVLGYLMRKRKARQKISLGETALQGVAAGFAGGLILLIGRLAGLPPEMCAVLVGLCGWLGADATLMLLQTYVYDKLKLSKPRGEKERS